MAAIRFRNLRLSGECERHTILITGHRNDPRMNRDMANYHNSLRRVPADTGKKIIFGSTRATLPGIVPPA